MLSKTLLVSWAPSTTGATPTGYVIYYQATGDQGSATVDDGSTTQQDIDVQDNQEYCITMVTLSQHIPSIETVKSVKGKKIYYVTKNYECILLFLYIDEALFQIRVGPMDGCASLDVSIYYNDDVSYFIPSV